MDTDAHIGTYQHLATFPRADSALTMLRKIASLVKPIMRARNWRVPVLAEMYPPEQNLLGLNTNRGARIDLRLRFPNDKTLFKELEEVVDTMLHELAHNVHGPHDGKFHALWNELRDQYEELRRKGYSGEGFLGTGQQLGGRRVPMHEMRRQARVEAERRRALQGLAAGSGQKVGGRPVLRGLDMRNVIADAVDRRGKILRGCGSGTSEGARAAEEASKAGKTTSNGFKSKKEEDEANERAINDALWELIQAEEDKAAGVEPEVWIMHDTGASGTRTDVQATSGDPPPIPNATKPASTKSTSSSRSSSSKAKIEGWVRSKTPKSATPAPETSKNRIKPPPNYAKRDYDVLRPRQASRLVSEDEQRRRISGHVDLISSDEDDSRPQTPQQERGSKQEPTLKREQGVKHEYIMDTGARSMPARLRPADATWACNICTLVNPVALLACDACGTSRPSGAASTTIAQRPDSVNRGYAAWTSDGLAQNEWYAPSLSSNNNAVMAQRKDRTLGITVKQEPKQEPLGWNCTRCGSFMERQWWTCSACGLMKTTS